MNYKPHEFLVLISLSVNAWWQPAVKARTGLKLFTNDEVLAVNQRGENSRQVYKKDGSMIWASQLSNCKNLYVGMFNISDSSREVALDFADLKLSKPVTVRDLWKHLDLESYKKQFSQRIAPHGSMLLKSTVK